jgi:hypothetical protein
MIAALSNTQPPLPSSSSPAQKFGAIPPATGNKPPVPGMPASQGINVNIYYPTANIGANGSPEGSATVTQGSPSSSPDTFTPGTAGPNAGYSASGSSNGSGGTDSAALLNASTSTTTNNTAASSTPTNPQEHLLAMYQDLQKDLNEAQAARSAYVEKRQQYSDALTQYQQTAGVSNDGAFQQAASNDPSLLASVAPPQPQPPVPSVAPTGLPQYPPANYFTPMQAPPNTPPTPDPYQQLANNQPLNMPAMQPSSPAANQPPSSGMDPSMAQAQAMLQDPQVMKQLAQMASQLSPQDVQALMQDPAVAQQVAQLTQQLPPQQAQALMASLANNPPSQGTLAAPGGKGF